MLSDKVRRAYQTKSSLVWVMLSHVVTDASAETGQLLFQFTCLVNYLL